MNTIVEPSADRTNETYSCDPYYQIRMMIDGEYVTNSSEFTINIIHAKASFAEVSVPLSFFRGGETTQRIDINYDSAGYVIQIYGLYHIFRQFRSKSPISHVNEWFCDKRHIVT